MAYKTGIINPYSKDINIDSAQKSGANWIRYIRIGLIDIGLDIYGGDIVISFNVTCEGDKTTANVTLTNLSNNVQRSIKRGQSITIEAGYATSSNFGLVFAGKIINLMDNYNDDGSIDLELDCVSLYDSIVTNMKPHEFSELTPIAFALEQVCSDAYMPLATNDISPNLVFQSDVVFAGTAKDQIFAIVDMANNLTVEGFDPSHMGYTATDVTNGRCYSITSDRDYLTVVWNSGLENYNDLILYSSSSTGLLSVVREDILSENFDTSTTANTINATIQFNWKIRRGIIVYIDSFKQNYLNGNYIVVNYSMRGNSHDGDHICEIDLCPIENYAMSLPELVQLYDTYTATPPSDD